MQVAMTVVAAVVTVAVFALLLLPRRASARA
jgi:hypothetical protein